MNKQLTELIEWMEEEQFQVKTHGERVLLKYIIAKD